MNVWRDSMNNGVNMSDLSDDFTNMHTTTPLSPMLVATPSYTRMAQTARTVEDFLQQYSDSKNCSNVW